MFDYKYKICVQVLLLPMLSVEIISKIIKKFYLDSMYNPHRTIYVDRLAKINLKFFCIFAKISS